MILDENLRNEHQTVTLTERDIFTRIWVEPRIVFRYVNENNYNKHVIPLLILAGLNKAMDTASRKNMGDHNSLPYILGYCAFGALLWWTFYYIYAALLRWTGQWLNGKGTTKSLVRMFAYSSIPSVIGLIIFLPSLFVFGVEMFTAENDLSDANMFLTIFYYASLIVPSLFSIWSVVVAVIGISEIQKISIGKSILNLVLPALAILIPMIIVIAIFRI